MITPQQPSLFPIHIPDWFPNPITPDADVKALEAMANRKRDRDWLADGLVDEITNLFPSKYYETD